jgi:hypothetical protein
VRPIHVPVTIQVAGDTVRVAGRVTFLQSAFGIRPYAMFFGAVRNQDQVEVVFDFLARRSGS